jgi:hypothetical protein
MRSVRMWVLVVSAISSAITVASWPVLELDLASGAPLPRAVLDAVPALIALAVGFVVCGHLLRRGLALAVGFVVCGHLLRRGLALAVSGAAVTATLLLIAILASAFAAHLPNVPAAATPQGLAGPDLHADAVLPALEVTVAAAYGLAAVGFLRLLGRFHDEFFSWLAIAAVLAAAAHVNHCVSCNSSRYAKYPLWLLASYLHRSLAQAPKASTRESVLHNAHFLHSTRYAQFVSIGDVFLLCFYAVRLAIETFAAAHSQSSMYERASSAGGDLGVSSAPGRGTEVEARL